ncbi:hypothetical protein [Bosea vaviloviae]|uniref:hypothetical protein n=1 Tax=Bosea vaviloviae TaxID=1526658 RepID=UPI0011E015E4|nr:hypothetical protein [Bosea vaviloviae]
MNSARFAAILVGCSLTIATSVGRTQAHPAGTALSAGEVALAIKGKICTTKTGAKFSFSIDGKYIYDGLWQSSGSYAIDRDSITVTFASGLRRAFTISVREGILYMEQTAISCAEET